MSNNTVQTGPAGLDDLLTRVERELTDDLVPVEIFNDDAVFKAEVERIFGRSWVFLGHQTEIPKAGDFVQRRLGTNPVIVTRDGEDNIHVLSNFCRHRGTQVCQTDQGNSRFFTCPYHGWTYDNKGELVGTPFMNRAYGERVDSKKWSLFKAPHVATKHGLIFATLADDPPTLDEYLGGAGWMLDALMGLHPDGMRVCGPPDRYHVKANWKTAADNFSGDVYHVPSLHQSMQECGVAPPLDVVCEYGRPYEFDGGHAFMGLAWSQMMPGLEYWGYQPNVREHFDTSALDETQLHVVQHDGPIVGTIFPNLSFFRGMGILKEGKVSVATSFRQWQPIGPAELEVWSWQFAWEFQDEESALLDATVGQQQFGVAGIAEQDDTVAWEGLARAGASPWARREQMALHFQQGNDSEVDQSFDPEWKGPGTRRLTGFGEHTQLHFYRHWLKEMQSEDEG